MGLHDIHGITAEFRILPVSFPWESQIGDYGWPYRCQTYSLLIKCLADLPLANFMSAVCERMDLMVTHRLFPPEYNADDWQFRTEGEALYLYALFHWGEGNPICKAESMWSNCERVVQEAIFWQKPIFLYEYKEFKRKNNTFFAKNVRFKRRSVRSPATSWCGTWWKLLPSLG